MVANTIATPTPTAGHQSHQDCQVHATCTGKNNSKHFIIHSKSADSRISFCRCHTSIDSSADKYNRDRRDASDTGILHPEIQQACIEVYICAYIEMGFYCSLPPLGQNDIDLIILGVSPDDHPEECITPRTNDPRWGVCHFTIFARFDIPGWGAVARKLMEDEVKCFRARRNQLQTLPTPVRTARSKLCEGCVIC